MRYIVNVLCAIIQLSHEGDLEIFVLGWYLLVSSRGMFPKVEPAVPICRGMLLIMWKHDKSRLRVRTLLWLVNAGQ